MSASRSAGVQFTRSSTENAPRHRLWLHGFFTCVAHAVRTQQHVTGRAT
jgi:hypothetical protein